MVDQDTIIALVVGSAVTGIVGYALAYVKYLVVNKAKKHEEKEKFFEEIKVANQQNIENFKQVSEHLQKMDANFKLMNKKIDSVAKGGMTLLRDRIIQSCRVFCERGSISLTAKTNIQDMYHYYHNVFGGNGVGEYYYNKMMRLPVDDNVITSPLIHSSAIPHDSEERLFDFHEEHNRFEIDLEEESDNNGR